MTRLDHPLFGLDSTSEVSPDAHKAVGSSFACRYLSRSSWKVLTVKEIRDLHAAGVGIAVVFEDGACNAWAGYSQGKSDAEFSRNQLTDLVRQALGTGLPPQTWCRAAVDADTAGNPGATDSYFDGWASVWTHDCCGPYGGNEVIYHQANRGFKALWATYAWSGHSLDSRAQLYQYSNDHYVGGVGVDYNHAYFADYGQLLAKPEPPADPHHYLLFPEGPFKWGNKMLFERWLVTEYDRLRIAPHQGSNKELLDLLREDLTDARKRVWWVAHYDPATARKRPTPDWGDSRGWRWKQLLRRSQGQRVV